MKYTPARRAPQIVVWGAMAKSQDTGDALIAAFLVSGWVYTHQSSKVIVPAYYEIDDRQRHTGNVWQQIQSHLTESKDRAILFCGQCGNNGGDPSDPHYSGNENATANAYFEKQRNCKEWYCYNAGLSPKDHYEQMKMETLEQSRREFELRLE